MKKKIQKPFSVEAWKNGAKVETKSGRSVRILCTDIKSAYSIVAATMCEDGEEAVTEYDADGHFCKGCEDNCDLVIVEEVEEPERWGEDRDEIGEGWYIDRNSRILSGGFLLNDEQNFRAFATKKQAKSALAMARISQLMAHDERYGGVVTDEEFRLAHGVYIITRMEDIITPNRALNGHYFLAFHTLKQRDLFLAENERLVKDYLMID